MRDLIVKMKQKEIQKKRLAEKNRNQAGGSSVPNGNLSTARGSILQSDDNVYGLNATGSGSQSHQRTREGQYLKNFANHRNSALIVSSNMNFPKDSPALGPAAPKNNSHENKIEKSIQ